MSYESIQIDKSHIIWETAKGTLILLPKKCKYEGYQFWIPSSFVKEGSAPKTVIISFRDDFKFKLEKYRRISHDKKELVDTVFVPAIELKEMFGIAEQPEKSQSQYQDAIIRCIQEMHYKVIDKNVSSLDRENYITIIKALEKQVPQKPTHEASLPQCFTCPTCKNVIDEFTEFAGKRVRVTVQHCKFCGQALDWEA